MNTEQGLEILKEEGIIWSGLGLGIYPLKYYYRNSIGELGGYYALTLVE